MTPITAHRGHSIFVAISESGGEYRATPVVCPAGESPHSEAAQRLTIDETFPTRAAAEAAAIRAARRWIDWDAT